MSDMEPPFYATYSIRQQYQSRWRALLEVRLNFPVYYGTGHEYDTLTRRFRKIGDEAEMVAGPYAIDRLIEDTFARCNV
jgi:hypothetical protein